MLHHPDIKGCGQACLIHGGLSRLGLVWLRSTTKSHHLYHADIRGCGMAGDARYIRRPPFGGTFTRVLAMCGHVRVPHLSFSAQDSMYLNALSAKTGPSSAFRSPMAWLQSLQSNPRTSLVLWLWSMSNSLSNASLCLPHIEQRPFWALNSASYLAKASSHDDPGQNFLIRKPRALMGFCLYHACV